MKKIFTLLCICTWFAFQINAQEFTYHSDSPFGIQIIRDDGTRSAQKLIFSDYDLDGDLDLFLTGLDSLDDADPLTWANIHYFIDMQENIGDQWNPFFADRSSIENFPFPLGYFLPAGGDLNDDRKTDFISFASVDFIGNRTGAYIRNMGDNTFETIRLDTMGLPDFVPESFFFPELLDLDGDGDLDLLMSGFDSAIAEEDGPDIPVYYYAKNVGTPSAPDLLGWFDNPYGLMPNPLVIALSGGDIDGDGDMDLIGAPILIPDDSMNYLYVHLNTPGPNGKPAFGLVMLSPYGLPSSFGADQLISPTLVDLNSDGDLDLFVFLSTSDDMTILQYYENNICNLVMSDMTVGLCEGDAFQLGGNTYSDAGNYTVVLQGTDGCDSIVNLTIEFIPPVDIFLNESICEGESFVIGGETFTQSGDYIVLIMGANGCDSIINLSLNVELVDNAVDVNENTLTVVLSGATYQWIDCDSGENIPGATGQVFIATVSGNYAVSITNSLSCTNISDCITVLISSLSNLELSSAVTLYPNPNKGIFYVENKSPLQLSTVTVMDPEGRIIDSFLLHEDNTVDISLLGKGFFILRIKTNGADIIKKLIVF